MLALALLFGATTATTIRNRLHQQSPAETVHTFAETQVGGTHSCQFNVYRVNNGSSTNYTNIVNTGALFTDSSFPATGGEMIVWSDYPGQAYMSNYATAATFQRLASRISNPVLFASNVDAYDIVQGQDADCYWITATSDDAHTGRMKNVFLT
jgi:hypothetical protein